MNPVLWASNEDRKRDPSRVGLIQLAYPILLESILRSTVSLIDVAFLSRVSDSVVSAVSVAGQYIMLSMILAMSVSSGTLVCINQALGMKNRSKVNRYASLAVVTNLLLGLLFGLPAGGALWTGLRRIAAVRVWTDLIRLKLPVAGRLIRCASLSRGLRSLGVMLSAGVPMLRALELAADAAGNAAVAAAFLKLRQAALEGTSLSKAAAEIDFFKPVAFQLIAAG